MHQTPDEELPSRLRSDYVPDPEGDKRWLLAYAATAVVERPDDEVAWRASLMLAAFDGATAEEITAATGLDPERVERLAGGALRCYAAELSAQGA